MDAMDAIMRRNELEELIFRVSGGKIRDVHAIMNCFSRGYYLYDEDSKQWKKYHIRSIAGLKEASIDELRVCRGIGEKRLSMIIEAKRIIEEEELG